MGILDLVGKKAIHQMEEHNGVKKTNDKQSLDSPDVPLGKEVIYVLILLALMWWMYEIYSTAMSYYQFYYPTNDTERQFVTGLEAAGYNPIARSIGGLIGASLLPLLAIMILWMTLGKYHKRTTKAGAIKPGTVKSAELLSELTEVSGMSGDYDVSVYSWPLKSNLSNPHKILEIFIDQLETTYSNLKIISSEVTKFKGNPSVCVTTEQNGPQFFGRKFWRFIFANRKLYSISGGGSENNWRKFEASFELAA